ncbi:50S ribosomal protein L6 [Fusobacterium sp. IOR10]|uniref:50S ribosomal protein L6 n=1 Tax=Fusobacterium sp. IOR10 TaxID=2665157 RepID=UPI0013D8BE28|nr:50S ribosomal protein L6 [Fusobacterium sp. IOR10]
MSRIGKQPIVIPAGVTVTVNDNNEVTVTGSKGTLTKEFNKEMVIKIEDNQIVVERPNEERFTRALHGTTRALIHNMVVGVSDGFKKTLKLVGVGYRAAVKGNGLELSLGYSHPVIIDPVNNIKFTVDKNTTVVVEGIEKDMVGQVAADIRSKRAPEPYKGKGVKYEDEVIRRKEGKKS